MMISDDGKGRKTGTQYEMVGLMPGMNEFKDVLESDEALVESAKPGAINSTYG